MSWSSFLYWGLVMMVHGFSGSGSGSGRRVGIGRIWERFADGHHAADNGGLDDWDQRCRLLRAFSGGPRLIGVGVWSGSMRDQGVGHVVQDFPARRGSLMTEAGRTNASTVNSV
jgi:hypothetical protein